MIDFERIIKALADGGVEFIVVGGFAARHHGAARLTDDLDILYARSPENIHKLVLAVAPLKPYLRGAPPNLPFRFDEETIRHGLNFTLTTDAGPLDCLGEISGVGDYTTATGQATNAAIFGVNCRFLDLDALIAAKRAAGRPKDFEAIAELEIIREERERQS